MRTSWAPSCAIVCTQEIRRTLGLEDDKCCKWFGEDECYAAEEQIEVEPALCNTPIAKLTQAAAAELARGFPKEVSSRKLRTEVDFRVQQPSEAG